MTFQKPVSEMSFFFLNLGNSKIQKKETVSESRTIIKAL